MIYQVLNMSVTRTIFYYIFLTITLVTVAIVAWLLPINTGYPVFDIIAHVMMMLDLEVCVGIFAVMLTAFIERIDQD